MSSIFTKIIKGEIPSYKIAEDDNYYAFLDISPLKEGHTLVVPKVEVDYIFDLDDDIYAGLMLFAKKVAKAVGKSIKCEKVGLAVIGLDVRHVHIHVIPLNSGSDLDFSKPKLQLSKEDMQKTASIISSNFI